MGVHSCHPSTREVKTGGQQFLGDPVSKRKKKNRKTKQNNKNMSRDLDVTVRSNRACSTHRQQACAWQDLSLPPVLQAAMPAPRRILGFQCCSEIHLEEHFMKKEAVGTQSWASAGL